MTNLINDVINREDEENLDILCYIYPMFANIR